MKKAFTIIELVIVISVLIILIGITIPSMRGMQQSGTLTKVKGELQTFQAAVESYYSNSSPNVYPGVPNFASNTIGATYLVSTTPQILNGPLYDPLNPAGSTEYGYYLSPNGQYYAISSVGPNGHWGCFAPGTMVLLANGDKKTIENLKVGDVLLGSQKSRNTVVHLQIMRKQNRKIYAFNNGRSFVTGDHPFMTTKGWEALDPPLAQKQHQGLKVGKLQVNDRLIILNNESIQIKKISSKVFKDAIVYSPQLDGNHTYYADGFLVHNSASPTPVSVNNSGVVSKYNGSSSDDICVSNGTGC